MLNITGSKFEIISSTAVSDNPLETEGNIRLNISGCKPHAIYYQTGSVIFSGDIKTKNSGDYSVSVTGADNANYTLENGTNLTKNYTIELKELIYDNITAIADVSWDEEKQLVTITGENVKTGKEVVILITIDSDTAYVNGKEVKLDSPAFIENDRTYMPIRFISEELGASVSWIEDEQKVIITK